MKVLVTGAAGFIGFYTAKVLLSKGHQVVGLDNINDYYDVNLKYSRLNELGIDKNEASEFNKLCKSKSENFDFVRMNLEDREELPKLFKNENCALLSKLSLM